VSRGGGNLHILRREYFIFTGFFLFIYLFFFRYVILVTKDEF